MPADIRLSILDQIQIAAPCPMKWEDMAVVGQGDDRTRFCNECSLHVHNISDMTRDEAERFLLSTLTHNPANPEGSRRRVCATFYRRPDGTILTRDCPIGLALLREKVRRAASRVLCAVVVCVTAGIAWASRSPQIGIRSRQPFAALLDWLTP
ncbi:MAG: hypothetical protein IT435_13805 [Phycisphaerales bacterium]|nr:hypothetical protein [Phycisphaerales bacterium]